MAAGNVSQQVVIPVVGTSLTLSGDSFVVQGSTIAYTVRATDSADSPIPGAQLTVRAGPGNTVSPTTVTGSHPATVGPRAGSAPRPTPDR